MGEQGFAREPTGGLTRLGKYDIIARLGQGGMSKVYLAVAHGAVDEVRKLVVLKVLHEHLVDNAEYVEMFLREARVAVDLSHPNVVHTYTVGEEDQRYCIVMEYINGVSLAQALSRARSESWSLEQRLPLVEALCLMLGGLNYVHEFRDHEGNLLRLVHRDLKPGNVLLSFDGQVKLLDFGVVKMTAPEHDQTQSLSLKGTVQYLAPEALQGSHQLDRRYDVFAAGLILWEIVTGKRLWGKREPLEIMRGLADDEMATMVDTSPEIPDALRPVLRGALAADRDTRYGTALELRAAIREFLHTHPQRPQAEDLAALLGESFGPLREKRQHVVRRRLRELRDGAAVRGSDVVLAGASDSFATGAPSTTSAAGYSPSVASLTPASTPAASNVTQRSPEAQRRGLGALLALAVALPVLLVGAYILFGGSTETPTAAVKTPATADASEQPAPPEQPTPTPVPEPEAAVVTVTVTPATATIELDGTPHPGNRVVLEGTDPNASHIVRAQAEGYTTESLEVTLSSSKELVLALRPVSDAAPPPTPEPADAAPPAAAPRTPRRRPSRSARGSAPSPQPTEPAVADAKPSVAPAPKPAGPRPGDDLNVKKKRKRGGSSPAIDAEIPWE